MDHMKDVCMYQLSYGNCWCTVHHICAMRTHICIVHRTCQIMHRDLNCNSKTKPSKIIQPCHKLRIQENIVTAGQAMYNNFLFRSIMKMCQSPDLSSKLSEKKVWSIANPLCLFFLHRYMSNL